MHVSSMTEGKGLFACVIAASMFVAVGVASAQNASPADLIYDSSGESVVITGFKRKDAKGHLTIPEFIDGKPVTSIGDAAFRSARLSGVTIPESVTSIGKDVFWGCFGIGDINIPSRLETIGSSAFRDLRPLKEVIIPESVVSIGSHAFTGCNSLVLADLPSHFTSVPPWLFANCDLREVNLPKGITTIGDGAFSGNRNLKSIVIPESVEIIGWGVESKSFDICPSLMEEEDPENWASG